MLHYIFPCYFLIMRIATYNINFPRKELKPPQFEAGTICSLCTSCFGLKDVNVEKEFDSYDDRNYFISSACEDGTRQHFVFKIHNGAQ